MAITIFQFSLLSVIKMREMWKLKDSFKSEVTETCGDDGWTFHFNLTVDAILNGPSPRQHPAFIPLYFS